MSLTVVAGTTLNLNLTDATTTVDLTVQTLPSFTLEFQAGQGPAGIGLPAGGFTDQVLAKNSNTSGDVSWKYVSPASVGLGNVDNTSDMDKPVSTAQQTAIDGAKAYADGLVVGLWDDRGSFDASVNTYPTSGGSGPAGAIKKGDVWTITVAATSGSLLGHSLGSTVRALADTPAQVDANWSVIDTGFSAATSGANSNITSLSGITGGIATADYLDFDTAAAATPAVGRLHWDANERGPAVTMAGGNVLLQIGQETVVNIFNNTGSALSDGQVVYCTGSQGQRLTVALARADSEITSETILGVVTEPIANNAEGFITVQGTVHGLNTTGFADGAKLYISPTTAGLLTATEPVAPDHSVNVGFVVKGGSAGAGSIYVQVQTGYELDELHDVKITSVAGGDVLTYDNAIPAWKNVTKANSGLARDGVVTDSGLTMATARLLGRTTAATGAVEEISVGSGLSLSAGTLSASASSTLNGITAAAGSATINNAENAIVWNWNGSTASRTGFTIGENAASTGGSGSQVLLKVGTLSASTADPLQVQARGADVIRVSSAGALTLASAGNASVTSTGQMSIVGGNSTMSIANSGATGIAIATTSHTGAGAQLGLTVGSSTNSTAGILTLSGGQSNAAQSGNSGGIVLTGGAAGAVASVAGGPVVITGGAGSTTTTGGVGGAVNITAGAGGLAAAGGALTLTTGSGGASGPAGALALNVGTTNGGTAPAVTSNATKFQLGGNAGNVFSTQIGYGGTASGSYSTAVGTGAIASSNYSTAIGSNSTGQASQSVTGSGAMALGGSYASGTDSFAAAVGNNTSTYGAQGANSVAMGYQAKATGQNAFSLGDSTQASALSSVAMGQGTRSAQTGKFSFGSGVISAFGDAQLGAIVLRTSTTTAAPAAVTSDGAAASAANQLILPNDSSYTFTGSMIARNTATDTDSKAWTFFGAIRRGVAAANTAFIGTPSINVVGSDGSAWTFTLTADTTNGGLAVTVTGEAAKTIRWVCRIDTVEVTG